MSLVTMAITIQIPTDIEKQLRQVEPDLDSQARDQFVIAQYCAGKLSTANIAEILGFETRDEAQTWLSDHNISINYSLTDLDQDRKNLDKIFGSR